MEPFPTPTNAPERRPEPVTKPAKATKTTSPDRKLIRKVAAKTVEIGSLPSDQRRLLGAVLNSPTDPVSLTTAALTAGRNDTAALNDLLDLASSDPLEAGVKATMLDRSRLKDIWQILHTVGALGSTTVPPSEAKAALAVARAVTSLDDRTLDQLRTTLTLIRRS